METLKQRLLPYKQHVRMGVFVAIMLVALCIGWIAQQSRNSSGASSLEDGCKAGSSSDIECVTLANFNFDFPGLPRDQDDGEATDPKPVPSSSVDCSSWPSSQMAYCGCLAQGGTRQSCADQSDTSRWSKCMSSYNDTNYCHCVVNSSPYTCAPPSPSTTPSPLFNDPTASNSPSNKSSAPKPFISSTPTSSGLTSPKASASTTTKPSNTPSSSPTSSTNPTPTSTPFDMEQCLSDNDFDSDYCSCLEGGGTESQCSAEETSTPSVNPTSTFLPN